MKKLFLGIVLLSTACAQASEINPNKTSMIENLQSAQEYAKNIEGAEVLGSLPEAAKEKNKNIFQRYPRLTAVAIPFAVLVLIVALRMWRTEVCVDANRAELNKSRRKADSFLFCNSKVYQDEDDATDVEDNNGESGA